MSRVIAESEAGGALKRTSRSARSRHASPTGHRRGATIFVALLTLAAFALRLYRIEAQSLWSDEGLSVYRAALPWAEILANTIFVDGVLTRDLSPPGYFLLLGLVRRLAGEALFALRLPGALLGALAVPLAWRAGRRWLGAPAGLGAATLLALSPIHVWYSQELRNYALFVVLILAATWALGPAVDGRRRVWPAWIGLWLAAAATHAFALLGIAAHVLWLVGTTLLRTQPSLDRGTSLEEGAAPRSARFRRRGLAFAVLAGLLVALPFAPRAFEYFRTDTQVDYAPVSLATIGRQALDAFAVGISPTLTHPPSASWPLAALAVLGLVFGLARSNRRRGTWLALSMLVLPLLLLAGLSAIRPIYNGPRHALVALPGFVLLAGAGLGALGEAALTSARLLGRGSAAAGHRAPGSASPSLLASARLAGAISLGLALALPAAWQLIGQLQRQFHDPDYTKDDVRGAAFDLARQAGPGDVIVVGDPLIQFAFDYEYRRAGGRANWRTIPRFGESERDAARRLRDLAEHAPRVWLLERPKPRTGFDPNYLTEKADEVWTRREERSYARMWLPVRWAQYDTGLVEEGSLPWHVPPTGGRPIGARFGPSLSLHSVAPCHAGQPTNIEAAVGKEPGHPWLMATGIGDADHLCLELRWETLDRPAVDWRVFVHLTSPGDPAPISQVDGPPMDAYGDHSGRTDSLSAGLYLRDQRRIDLPADLDEAWLRVGLYDPNTMARAAIVGEDGVALGDAFELIELRRR